MNWYQYKNCKLGANPPKKPKLCEICSVKFKRTSNLQKYCEPCGKKNKEEYDKKKSQEYYDYVRFEGQCWKLDKMFKESLIKE